MMLFYSPNHAFFDAIILVTHSSGNLKLIKALHERIPHATAKKHIRVIAIGGSVTNGGGCESYALGQSKHGFFGPCSWTMRFVKWLKRYYGNNFIDLMSLAQPATTTNWVLSHFQMFMSYQPDLLLVDYSINDAIIAGRNEEVQRMHDARTRAATERLIRAFYKHNQHRSPPAAIIYVAMHRSSTEPSLDNRYIHNPCILLLYFYLLVHVRGI
jgi:hypothetical protein